MYSVSLRATTVALLTAGALLVPGVASAATNPTNTGTVVGTVTCGPAEESPASHIVVTVDGGNGLQTVTGSDGGFSLALPAQQNFTIDALADPQASVVSSRYNISVQPGETLNIGSMDLAICGQPVAPAAPAPNPLDDEAAQVGQDR